MPCSSCGGGSATATPPEDQYTVTYPNGEVKTLGDHDSKVAMTMNPGARRELVKR
jgi:hypothetical protein